MCNHCFVEARRPWKVCLWMFVLGKSVILSRQIMIHWIYLFDVNISKKMLGATSPMQMWKCVETCTALDSIGLPLWDIHCYNLFYFCMLYEILSSSGLLLMCYWLTAKVTFDAWIFFFFFCIIRMAMEWPFLFYCQVCSVMELYFYYITSCFYVWYIEAINIKI